MFVFKWLIGLEIELYPAVLFYDTSSSLVKQLVLFIKKLFLDKPLS